AIEAAELERRADLLAEQLGPLAQIGGVIGGALDRDGHGAGGVGRVHVRQDHPSNTAPSSPKVCRRASTAATTAAGQSPEKNARATPMRRPATARSNPAVKSGTGHMAELGSRGSCPARTCSISAASRTVRVSGPA